MFKHISLFIGKTNPCNNKTQPQKREVEEELEGAKTEIKHRSFKRYRKCFSHPKKLKSHRAKEELFLKLLNRSDNNHPK